MPRARTRAEAPPSTAATAAARRPMRRPPPGLSGTRLLSPTRLLPCVPTPTTVVRVLLPGRRWSARCSAGPYNGRVTLQILLTNDDGIFSPGIAVLRRALEGLGEVTTIAPDHDSSAVARAITLERGLRVWAASFGGGYEGLACDGTPSDCVRVGLLGIRAPAPALVISGRQHGLQHGRRHHLLGHRGCRLRGRPPGPAGHRFLGGALEPRWLDEAVPVLRALVEEVIARGLPRHSILNVNLPDRPLAEMAGSALPASAAPAATTGCCCTRTAPCRPRPRATTAGALGADRRRLTGRRSRVLRPLRGAYGGGVGGDGLRGRRRRVCGGDPAAVPPARRRAALRALQLGSRSGPGTCLTPPTGPDTTPWSSTSTARWSTPWSSSSSRSATPCGPCSAWMLPDEVITAGVGQPLLAQMQRLSAERARELYDVYREYNHRRHDELIRGYDGVPEVLAELRARAGAWASSPSRATTRRRWRSAPSALEEQLRRGGDGRRHRRSTSLRRSRCWLCLGGLAPTPTALSTSATAPSTSRRAPPPGWHGRRGLGGLRPRGAARRGPGLLAGRAARAARSVPARPRPAVPRPEARRRRAPAAAAAAPGVDWEGET